MRLHCTALCWCWVCRDGVVRYRYGGTSGQWRITALSWPAYIMCHNAVAASFFPALVSSIQFARDVEFSIFSEAERLV